MALPDGGVYVVAMDKHCEPLTPADPGPPAQTGMPTAFGKPSPGSGDVFSRKARMHLDPADCSPQGDTSTVDGRALS